MLYLASQSPRRRELLAQLGVAFEVLQIDVAEIRAADELAQAYVERVARDKAVAGLACAIERDQQAVVLGADTEVVLDDRVFGKPRDDADAAAMLRALSGRTHRVITAVWCMDARREQHVTNISEVTFAPLSDTAIDAYVHR